MYSNNFAAAIKVGGKVLREFDKDTVYIPFGSEYTILLKNLNTVRASVNITIDGTNITGGGIILNAGQEIDLERSIKNGNLAEGHKLKFIERTSKIEDHRGIKLQDGLVRVEYVFEQVPTVQFGTPVAQWVYPYNTPYTKHYNDGLKKPDSYSGNSDRGILCSTTSSMKCGGTYGSRADSLSSPVSSQMNCNDTGITVDGGKSQQQFAIASYFNADYLTKTVMIFKLLGETEDNKAVRSPVTVKTKIECPTCGTINKATSKFCSECGTGLEII